MRAKEMALARWKSGVAIARQNRAPAKSVRLYTISGIDIFDVARANRARGHLLTHSVNLSTVIL